MHTTILRNSRLIYNGILGGYFFLHCTYYVHVRWWHPDNDMYNFANQLWFSFEEPQLKPVQARRQGELLVLLLCGLLLVLGLSSFDGLHPPLSQGSGLLLYRTRDSVQLLSQLLSSWKSCAERSRLWRGGGETITYKLGFVHSLFIQAVTSSWIMNPSCANCVMSSWPIHTWLNYQCTETTNV